MFLGLRSQSRENAALIRQNVEPKPQVPSNAHSYRWRGHARSGRLAKKLSAPWTKSAVGCCVQ